MRDGRSLRPGFGGWYLIVVLTLAYTASFLDRQVLNLLVGPLKADFGLSDTRLSLLQGVSFTCAYIVFSPIFGRLADVGNRRTIIIAGVVMWSVGTMLCGLSNSYWELFAARFLVGGAEACLTPAAWSIIADRFPPRLIPRAFSIFMIAPYLGGGLALIFGGLLLSAAAGWHVALPMVGALQPWQVVFVAVGLPGLLIALMMLAVHEPPRHDGQAVADESRLTLREVWQGFAARRAFYGNFYPGMAMLVITLYAFPAWLPTVLMRRFHASPRDVGLDYGMLVLVSGSLGVLVSPWVARLIERRGRADALVFVPFCATFGLLAAAALLPLAGSYGQILAIATFASFVYSLPQALASSALQLVTPNRMRGVAASVYVFVVSVTGLGAAPTIVALLTDHLFADETRVGDSLAITCAVASLVSASLLWRALGAYRALRDEAG